MSRYFLFCRSEATKKATATLSLLTTTPLPRHYYRCSVAAGNSVPAVLPQRHHRCSVAAGNGASLSFSLIQISSPLAIAAVCWFSSPLFASKPTSPTTAAAAPCPSSPSTYSPSPSPSSSLPEVNKQTTC